MPKINKKSRQMVDDKSIGEENVESLTLDESGEGIKKSDRVKEMYIQGLKKKQRMDKLQSIHLDSNCTF